MSDSSDDEPLAAKRAKLANGSAKPQKASDAQTQAKVKTQQGAAPKSASKGSKIAEGPKRVKENKNAKPAKQSKSSETSKAEKITVKREKKVYDLPGQTRETPDELDPLRKFYTSLKLQRPDSQMAKKWMCMYGLLSREEAEAFLKEAGKNVKSPAKKERCSQGRKNPGPRKSGGTKNSSASKRKAHAVKKEEDSEDSEEEKGPAKQKSKPRIKKESKTSKPSVQKPKGKYAVFEDMDSDSDDDKPLGQRV